uniref:C2H2-type domain-containing protein n=1 Tax=Cynoglossus semilaevis TaxID=244447 RepID=A0A3P8WPD1_CYNSE
MTKGPLPCPPSGKDLEGFGGKMGEASRGWRMDMNAEEVLKEMKPVAATLDPRHLSQALASAFQPRQGRSRQTHVASSPSSSQLLNFSVRLRELAKGNNNTSSASPGCLMLSPSSSPPSDFPCDICDRNFLSVHALTNHRRTHACERPYHCGVCGLAFSSKLTRHMKTHGAQGVKAPFLCQLCSVPFTVYATLEKHLKKVHALHRI